MNGAESILIERRRQIEQEGWMPEHDDRHNEGQLAIAAACYAVAGFSDVNVFRDWNNFKSIHYDAWPWRPKWDKRKKHDRRRCLVIAGALIAAEIDRLDRKAKVRE